LNHLNIYNQKESVLIMCDRGQAKNLISEAEENLALSGATIISAEKEIEEIDRKSQEYTKKLSFLL